MLWAPEKLPELSARYPKLAAICQAFQEMIPATQAAMGEDRLRWLETLPYEYSVQGVTVIHARPDNLWRSSLDKADDRELEDTYRVLASPVVIYGHIHRPYIRQLPGMKVENTGSVSLSYDGDSRASYLMVDSQDISVRRVEYDREREADDLLHSGLPRADWLCQILRTGRYCAPEGTESQSPKVKER